MTLPGWDRANAAFMARLPRERMLLMAVATAVLVLGGWLLLIEPAVLQRSRLQREIQDQTIELENLQPRLDVLQARPEDPEAGRRAQVEVLRGQIARVDADFAGLERSLVAPRDMGRVVEGLLKQHGGLQLLAWRSLPVRPIGDLLKPAGPGVDAGPVGASAQPAASAPGGRAPSATATPGPSAESWLYLHGVEISVSGSYADMQSWLQQVEGLPRRLYWGPLTVDAKTWPTSVMTVTLYTVSLERTWWSL